MLRESNGMDYIEAYFRALYLLVTEMAPYLLLGFVFAGLLKVFFPPALLHRYMGKSNSRSVFFAGLLGVPLPLCSCGVLPTGISLYRNGASRGSATSFLISTPQTGVDSILVTYSMLGAPMAVIRPVVALITGFFGGVFTNLFVKDQPASACTMDEKGIKEAGNSLRAAFRYAFVELVQDLAKWLIIGLLLAAMISVLVPDNYFLAIRNRPVVEMLVVLLGSIPMYVCATASVPLAAVLLLKGLSPGAVFVFLMAGPATNAATITVLWKSLGRLNTLVYLFTIITGAIVAAVLINMMPVEWFHFGQNHMGHHHESLMPPWFQIASAVFLVLILAHALLLKYKNLLFMNVQESNSPAMLQIRVSGMECNHCKKSVEANLARLEGVSEVSADITSGLVQIHGKDVNLDVVEQTVNGLGYRFDGRV